MEDRTALSTIINPDGVENYYEEAEPAEPAYQAYAAVTVYAMLVNNKATIVNAVNSAQASFDSLCQSALQQKSAEANMLTNARSNAENAINNLAPNDPNLNGKTVDLQGQIQDFDTAINQVDNQIISILDFQEATDAALQAIISGITTITTAYMGQTMTQYQSQGLVASEGWD